MASPEAKVKWVKGGKEGDKTNAPKEKPKQQVGQAKGQKPDTLYYEEEDNDDQGETPQTPSRGQAALLAGTFIKTELLGLRAVATGNIIPPKQGVELTPAQERIRKDLDKLKDEVVEKADPRSIAGRIAIFLTRAEKEVALNQAKKQEKKAVNAPAVRHLQAQETEEERHFTNELQRRGLDADRTFLPEAMKRSGGIGELVANSLDMSDTENNEGGGIGEVMGQYSQEQNVDAQAGVVRPNTTPQVSGPVVRDVIAAVAPGETPRTPVRNPNSYEELLRARKARK